MPQPDSSRDRAQDLRWNESERWPVAPATPHRFGARRGPPVQPPKQQPEKDGRTPDDKDGNEELERELEEQPSSRRARSDRQASLNTARREFEYEDTGEWAATERFTLEDELEDTWPNVPVRNFDD